MHDRLQAWRAAASTVAVEGRSGHRGGLARRPTDAYAGRDRRVDGRTYRVARARQEHYWHPAIPLRV
jgi:hypothetical protein